MSHEASIWAWSQKVGNPTRKLVLVALADHSNPDGQCWPTMDRLAERAECSRRTVERHLDELERAGLVRKMRRRLGRHGRFSGWDYQLSIHPTPTSHGPSDTHDRPSERPTDTSDGWDATPVSDGPSDTGVGSGTVRGGTVSEPSGSCSSPRKRDELWEAVLATCQWQQSELTKSARGAANRAVKDLRDVGASPDDIAPRAAEYRRRWPNMSLTPTALAKNWAELGSPAPAGSNGNGHWNGQGRPPVKYVGDFSHVQGWETFTP